MNYDKLGLFEVVHNNDEQFRFTTNAGEFTIDRVNSALVVSSDGNDETILLDEILRLEYGTMTRNLPPNSWMKLWLLLIGGWIPFELFGNYRDEEKWFQISAVLRSGDRIPLHLSIHTTNIRNTQLDVADQLQSAFAKHGRIMGLNLENRVVEDEFPQFSESSQGQPNPQVNIVDINEVIRWVAFSSAAVILAGIFTLGIGGGLIVASFQWLFIRRYLSKMRGVVWIGAGLVSTVTALGTVGPISLLMFAESTQMSDKLTAIIMLLAGHLFFLNLIQTIIWPLMETGDFKKAIIWGLVNSVIIVLAFLGSFIPISFFETNLIIAIIGEIIILLFVFIPSGYLIARTLTPENRKLTYKKNMVHPL